jgi:endonuclease/exonuclease/phosphatase family metal-dependent hydrolase
MVQLRNQHAHLPCILSGDLNINLTNPTPGPRTTYILDALMFVGLIDMSSHFRQRQRFQDGCTWRQHREGRWIRSRCDYILTDASRKHFRSVRIAEPQHYDSDHYALCFTLNISQPHLHTTYVRGRRAFP